MNTPSYLPDTNLPLNQQHEFALRKISEQVDVILNTKAAGKRLEEVLFSSILRRFQSCNGWQASFWSNAGTEGEGRSLEKVRKECGGQGQSHQRAASPPPVRCRRRWASIDGHFRAWRRSTQAGAQDRERSPRAIGQERWCAQKVPEPTVTSRKGTVIPNCRSSLLVTNLATNLRIKRSWSRGMTRSWGHFIRSWILTTTPTWTASNSKQRYYSTGLIIPHTPLKKKKNTCIQALRVFYLLYN